MNRDRQPVIKVALHELCDELYDACDRSGNGPAKEIRNRLRDSLRGCPASVDQLDVDILHDVEAFLRKLPEMIEADAEFNGGVHDLANQLESVIEKVT